MNVPFQPIPSVPSNFQALWISAITMEPGIEQYRILKSIEFGRAGSIVVYISAAERARREAYLKAHPVATPGRNPNVADRLAKYRAFTLYCALNSTPNFLQALNEYNTGAPFSQPWFERLFGEFNSYMKQGQAARGKLTASLAKAIVEQWIQDARPGGMDKAIAVAMTVALSALGAFVGGSVYGLQGATVGKQVGKQIEANMLAPESPQIAPASAKKSPPPNHAVPAQNSAPGEDLFLIAAIIAAKAAL